MSGTSRNPGAGRILRRGCGNGRGFTVLELLIATILTGLCLSAAWTVFVHHRRAALFAAGMAEGLEVVRTTRWLLTDELYGSLVGRDFHPEAGDSLVLRVFRGIGFQEGTDSLSGALEVCFQGLRAVDLSKDSLLVLSAEGVWHAVALKARTEIQSPCPGDPGGSMEAWELDPPLRSTPVFMRVFESGAYFLRDGAFRYRRGSGGRQPLTPERIQDGFFSPGRSKGQKAFWALRLEGPEGSPAAFSWEGAAW